MWGGVHVWTVEILQLLIADLACLSLLVLFLFFSACGCNAPYDTNALAIVPFKTRLRDSVQITDCGEEEREG